MFSLLFLKIELERFCNGDGWDYCMPWWKFTCLRRRFVRFMLTGENTLHAVVLGVLCFN